MTRSKSSSAHMTKESGYKVARDDTPAGGQYYPDQGNGFGNFTGSYYGFGNKYLNKVDNNPPPGYYKPNVNITKPKSKSAHIVKIPNVIQHPKHQNPDAGQYEPN